MLVKTACRDTRPSLQLLHGNPFSFKKNPTVSSSIILLFFTSCPAAVLRRVRTIIIDTIQAVVTRWSRPHIGDEVTYIPRPSIAHVDPSPPVSPPGCAIRVGTPLDHTVPKIVQFVTVEGGVSPYFCQYTPARLYDTRLQVRDTDRLGNPTRAAAKSHSMGSLYSGSWPNHGKPIDNSTGWYNGSWHVESSLDSRVWGLRHQRRPFYIIPVNPVIWYDPLTT